MVERWLMVGTLALSVLTASYTYMRDGTKDAVIAADRVTMLESRVTALDSRYNSDHERLVRMEHQLDKLVFYVTGAK